MKIETDKSESLRPSLETSRLILRPFDPGDAPVMQVLCNDREIAANTRSIEHPYPDGAALHWIEQHPNLWIEGKAAVFAVCLRATGELIGAIGLEISETNQNAELGYWIGRKYWKKGYCTEAASAVVEFGFEGLALNRIHSNYLTRNPASGRVMEKIGMTKEGFLRKHVRKWGVFEDVELFGILKSDPRPGK